MFKDRLKKAMKDLHLNQIQVSGMTGRSRASICQYLAGAQVPPDAVQRSMAAALGLDVEYFTAPDAPQHTDPVPKRHGGIRQLSLKQAAALLGVDKETVGKGLQQGVFPWGVRSQDICKPLALHHQCRSVFSDRRR